MSIVPARRALFSLAIRLCMSMSKTSVNVVCQFSSRNVVFGPFGFIVAFMLMLLLLRFHPRSHPPPPPTRLHVDENFSQAPDISHKNHFPYEKLFRSFLSAVIIKNISIFVSSHLRVLEARNFISFFRAKCRLFIIPRRKKKERSTASNVFQCLNLNITT